MYENQSARLRNQATGPSTGRHNSCFCHQDWDETGLSRWKMNNDLMVVVNPAFRLIRATGRDIYGTDLEKRTQVYL